MGENFKTKELCPSGLCPEHGHIRGYGERIAKLETQGDERKGQVDDLYDKHQMSIERYESIKICLERLDLTVKTGFEMQISNTKNLEEMFNKQLKTSEEIFNKQLKTNDALIVKYDGIIDGFNKQFRTITDSLVEINAFKWFRDGMNKLRDKLPWWALWGLIVAIGILICINGTEFGARLTKFLGGKG